MSALTSATRGGEKKSVYCSTHEDAALSASSTALLTSTVAAAILTNISYTCLNCVSLSCPVLLQSCYIHVKDQESRQIDMLSQAEEIHEQAEALLAHLLF